MRKRIHREPKIGKLEQGAIFNGCIAEEYPDREVFGIIITPRCDIANEKVTTYHYLPIVRYQDWLRVNFWEFFREILIKDLKSQLKNLLKQKQKSPHVVDYFNVLEIEKEFLQFFTKEKEIKKFEELITDLNRLGQTNKQNPNDSEFLFFFSKFDKLTKTILKEIRSNKRNDFYLIESFESDHNDDYHIILSREVKRITIDIGNKIGTGLDSSILSENDYYRNDIRQSNQPIFIMIYSVLESPILEHLIQHFNQNFARIGVADHPINLVDSLFNNC